MDRYTPIGWRCSEAGRRRFAEVADRMTALVVLRVRKYNHVPGMAREDLFQEGMQAASYAVDTFAPDRGVKLETYVGRVIERTLAMIAAKKMARCRAPRRHEQSEDGYTEVLDSGTGVDPDTLPASLFDEDDDVEDRRGKIMRLHKMRCLRSESIGKVTRLAASVLTPAPEDVVAARNAVGRVPRPSEVVVAMGLPRQAAVNASLEFQARVKKCRPNS